MDQSTREVFCNLTWPTSEEVLNVSDTPPRRPSPFWLKEKLASNRPRTNNNHGNTQNASVTRRWKEISQFAELRLLLHLEPYNYTRSTVFLQCRNYKFLDIRKYDYGTFLVDAVSNGLLLESESCRITSVFTVIHPSSTSRSEVLHSISKHFRGYDIITSMTAVEDLKMKSEKNYHRIFMPSGKIKRAHASVMNELIRDPLEHLNTIAANSNIKRSVARKAYVDLVKGGMFHLTPFIRSEDYRDFVVARFYFRVSEDARPKILMKILENSYVRNNYLQIWQYNPEIIMCLISAPNVQQLIQLTKQLTRDLKGVDLMTEIKHYGYFFRESAIEIVRRHSALPSL